MSMRFLANSDLVTTDAWPMTPALEFIRKELRLTGTKEGCREGDCGACAVILGERGSGLPEFRAVPSCLLALGELEGRQLLTIEGLAAKGQTPVMAAMAEANGSQCGFCSPGFVMSLSAYLVNGGALSVEGAFAAVEGNLCRCTGYGSIKRAASRLVEEFSGLPEEPLPRIDALVAAGVLPPSCAAFARGELLPAAPAAAAVAAAGAAPGTAVRGAGAFALGGGTDFFVRNPQPDEADFPSFELLDRRGSLKSVALLEPDSRGARRLELGAALSWREFFASSLVRQFVPGIQDFEYLLASPLIRERATIGGNIANASPVGDLTAMLIALSASLRLERGSGGGEGRELALEELFLGYKKLDLAPAAAGRAPEIIAAVILPAAVSDARFNFEKASKRERLDIAAVNSAAMFELENGGLRIRGARISAGGVAPVPLLLARTSAYLAGRAPDAETAIAAARLAVTEVKPIDDVRGSADYRRRVLERLVLAHFITLFPGRGIEEAIA